MKANFEFALLFIVCVCNLSPLQAQIPRMNSDLSASATIFLDFDGQYVTGTSWNWNGPIDAQSSGLSTAAITEIFNRVSEDYRPFNLNITTDSSVYSAAPYNKRSRVIITASSDWYGRAGGVAFVGSFTWGDETPAWVFSALLNFNTKYIAEACSHEAGHTVGLQHQSTYDNNCNKIAEYSAGQGVGEIGWAPIMGVGYYRNLTTWHTGPNTAGCNVIQNDLNVIAGSPNNFGFRNDDHGDNPSTSTVVSLQGQTFLVNGLIDKPNDPDAFKIQVNSTTNFKLNAIPQNVGNGNQGANIDIKISILNSAFDTIGTYNPSTLLDADIDTNLNVGAYYIIIKGTGNINHSDYGSLGYYSLNGSLYAALPVSKFVLKGNNNNGNDFLSWTLMSNETLNNIVIESSPDGKQFRPLITLGEQVRNFTYSCLSTTTYYRLKATTMADERTYYSNVINLTQVAGDKPAHILSNLVQESIMVAANGAHSYQVYDGSGKLMAAGRLAAGLNRIDVTKAASGILLMRLNNGVVSWTEKLVKRF